MLADTFQCPQCQARLKYSSAIQPGTAVRCRQCQNTFSVPAAAPAQPPPTGSAAGGEITTEPGTGSRRERVTENPYEPNYRDRRYLADDGDYPRSPPRTYHERGPNVLLSNRYDAEASKWFTIAIAHYTAIFGPAIGYLAIVYCTQIALFFLANFLREAANGPLIVLPLLLANSIFLLPAIFAGLLAVCLKQLDDRPWTFGDFFSGFHGPTYTKMVLLTLLYVLVLSPVVVPLSAAALVIMNFGGPDETTLALLVVSFALLPVVIYFAFRLFLFATPLILDRGFGPSEAIKGSWTLTKGHFWVLWGIYLSVALGVCLVSSTCTLAVLFVLPLATLFFAACCLDVTGIDPLPRPRRRRPQREHG